MKKSALALLLLPILIRAGAVHANDTIAAVKTEGLTLLKSDSIRLKEETLTISATKIHVRYDFLNESSQPINTPVAFPLPLIGDTMYANHTTFPDFEVLVNGKKIPWRLVSKAEFKGNDITSELEKHGLPTDHFPDFRKLPEATRKWLLETGYQSDKNPDHEFQATYELRLTYVWDQVFPPGQVIHVEHKYTPQPGSISDGQLSFSKKWMVFFSQEGAVECLARHREKEYCSENEAWKGTKRTGLFAHFVEYVLSTGSNWKNGIEKFRFRAEGAPVIFAEIDNERFFDLESFELERTSFKPKGEILIEFLQPFRDWRQDVPAARLVKKIDGPANCRADASPGSNVVFSIPDGSEVLLRARRNDWYQVGFKERACWTHRRNLRQS